MPLMLRFLFIILLATLFIGCCTSGLNKRQPEPADEPTIGWDPSTGHGQWEDCDGDIGNHACNFKFLDQHGSTWELYDHYGDIIILDFSTAWCGACMGAAVTVQEFQDKYGPENVIWVTVLLQDVYGQLPTVYHADEWAKAFGIKTSPVLVANKDIFPIVSDEGYGVSSLPTIVIIDRNMVNTHVMKGWNKLLLHSLMGEMLNSTSN